MGHNSEVCDLMAENGKLKDANSRLEEVIVGQKASMNKFLLAEEAQRKAYTALEAEVKDYREALEKIVENSHPTHPNSAGGHCSGCLAELALAKLKGKT